MTIRFPFTVPGLAPGGSATFVVHVPDRDLFGRRRQDERRGRVGRVEQHGQPREHL